MIVIVLTVVQANTERRMVLRHAHVLMLLIYRIFYRMMIHPAGSRAQLMLHIILIMRDIVYRELSMLLFLTRLATIVITSGMQTVGIVVVIRVHVVILLRLVIIFWVLKLKCVDSVVRRAVVRKHFVVMLVDSGAVGLRRVLGGA